MVILTTLAVGLLLPAQGPADKDRQLLQGKWEVVSIVSKAGKDKEEPKPGQMLVVVANDKMISKEGAKVWGEATFTLDSSKSPRTIDLHTTDDKGKIFLGIYELNGADLKMCLSTPKNARPTDFTSSANQSVIVMRRLKE